jgi:hypothetical protein
MRPKYPNRITVCMTDDLFKTIKSDLGLRHMLGDLGKDDCTILLLNIIKAIDDQESGPIFLRSIKESERNGK